MAVPRAAQLAAQAAAVVRRRPYVWMHWETASKRQDPKLHCIANVGMPPLLIVQGGTHALAPMPFYPRHIYAFASRAHTCPCNVCLLPIALFLDQATADKHQEGSKKAEKIRAARRLTRSGRRRKKAVARGVCGILSFGTVTTDLENMMAPCGNIMAPFGLLYF